MPTHPGGRDRRGMSTASANDARQHLPTAGSTSQPGRAIPALSAEQLTQVLKLVKHADSVELKPECARRRPSVRSDRPGHGSTGCPDPPGRLLRHARPSANRSWGCRPGQAGPAEAGRLRRQARTGRTRRTSGRTTQIPRLLSRGRRHARRFRLLRVHEGRGNRCRPEGSCSLGACRSARSSRRTSGHSSRPTPPTAFSSTVWQSSGPSPFSS